MERLFSQNLMSPKLMECEMGPPSNPLQDNLMMKTLITNIQGDSIHDGPGIRTLVFFKGRRLNVERRLHIAHAGHGQAWVHQRAQIGAYGRIHRITCHSAELEVFDQYHTKPGERGL